MRARNYNLSSTFAADATILDVWSANRKLSQHRASWGKPGHYCKQDTAAGSFPAERADPFSSIV
jgi:hypothetical protein